MSEENKEFDGANSADLSKENIIKEFLGSQQFIDTINAERTKAIDKFQSEKLPTVLESKKSEWIKAQELAQQKSPMELKLQEALDKLNESNQRVEASERAKLVEQNKNLALKSLSDKKYPTEILDFLVSDEQEQTSKNIDIFTNMMESYTTDLRSSFMKGNNTFQPGENPPKGGLPEPGPEATEAQWEAWYRKSKQK